MLRFFGSNPTLASGATIPLSAAAKAGDFVFTSGQLALDADGRLVEGDIERQTQVAIERIERLLADCDATLRQVVKATVWLSRAEDFAGFNRAYAQAFPNLPPTRSTVVSELLIPGALVEIEVVAYVGE